MTKNEFDRQTMLTTLADKLAYFVLELGQITEIANLSQFLKFIFKSCTNGLFGYVRYTSLPFTKPKETFFANLSITINL